jgi:pimeloyl-ACP methyl ester carboxylesterase
LNSDPKLEIRRAFADTPKGQIHYRLRGHGGKTVLLLHQTPRSSAEFLYAMPLFPSELQVIAMDTIGYGDSYKPAAISSIEDYARGAIDLLDHLKISKTSLVGHHTGSLIAFELAATYPERVEKIVLSHGSYFDASKRESVKTRPAIDEIEVKSDGTHLVELWNKRKGFYPKNRTDLFQNFLIDALKAGDKLEEGHRACANYHMEDKIERIRCPVLLICGTDDPFSFPEQNRFQAKLKGSTFKPIPGGMVPLPDQMPEQFVQAIQPFLLQD